MTDPAGLAALVARDYDLGRPGDCRLLSSGINDVFGVLVEGASYALRLQPVEKWWVPGEGALRFELDLLTHLNANGLPVSYPIPRHNGDLLGRLRTSAGERFYSLFSWAAGEPPEPLTAEHVHVVGRVLAEIHLAAESYRTGHDRYRLDTRTLLDRSLRVLAPALGSAEPELAGYIRSEVARLSTRLREFDPGPHGWGVIHGDVQPLNYHFTPAGQITFFDFDHCGFGWRAYDVAMYYTRLAEELRAPMLAGYQAIRPLNAAELRMLPDLGKVAWIKERTMVGDGMPPAELAAELRALDG
ncbi:homoserine kinase [Flindersiella endophytica]